MKRNIQVAFLILVGVLAFLSLKKPLLKLLIEQEFTELKAELISGIIIRGILLVLIIFIIVRLHLRNFTGLGKIKIYNFQSVLIALAFIGIGINNNWNAYTSVESSILYLFFISVLVVGFLEEFLFRGTILPLFIRGYKKNKNVLLLSAILSSILFGIIHYINLFSEPNNFVGISSQVIFAFAIGVFFTGLILRTKNILIPAILHGLINFAFGTGDLTEQMNNSAMEISEKGDNWGSIILTGIFFIFILTGGIYMIKKTTKEEILTKLENEKVLPPTTAHKK